MNYTCVIICVILTGACGLTCDDILKASETKEWSLNELKLAKPKEIIKCLVHLSKLPMPIEESRYVWNTLVEYFGNISLIPEDILSQLHWVTVAIEPEEFQNIPMNNIDIISNFGLNYNLSKFQLSAIDKRIKEDWVEKSPEEYTAHDLVSLRQILCIYNESEIVKIHPKAYKEAASVLGKLFNCAPEVLSGFAKLAVHPKAFGDPSKWTAVDVNVIGTIIHSLPREVTYSIPRNAFKSGQSLMKLISSSFN